MSDTPDLTDCLAVAAAEAVRARRGAIESAGAGALRGLHVEIEPLGRGADLSAEMYVQWRQRQRGRVG